MWQRIIWIALLLHFTSSSVANVSTGDLEGALPKAQTRDQGLWMGVGASSVYSSRNETSLSQTSSSLGMSYQVDLNEDLSFSSQVRAVLANNNSPTKLDSLIAGAVLKFHLNFKKVRLFVGPSFGSVYKSPLSGDLLSPSLGINYGLNFDFFGLRAAVESQSTYVFDPSQNSSSISEFLFKIRLL